MSKIVVVGASTSKGGYYAAMMEKEGHQVLKVGKGGPDFNLDLRWSSSGQIDSIFSKCRTKFGDWPRHIILNADVECEKDLANCDPCKDWGQLLQCNMWAPAAIAMAFVRMRKFHSPTLRSAIIYVAKVKQQNGNPFFKAATDGVVSFMTGLDRYCQDQHIAAEAYEIWSMPGDTRETVSDNLLNVIRQVETPTE